MALTYDKLIQSVSLLLHGEGTNLSTVVTDSSPTPKTITATNGAAISTTQAKWGTASIFTDGVNDFVSAADHAQLRLGAGDCTIEGWCYFPVVTGAGYVVCKGISPVTYASWVVYRSGTSLVLYASSNGTAWDIASGVVIGTVAAATWYYFAVNRTAGVIRLYLGGVLGTSFAAAAAFFEDTSPVYIGADKGAASFSNQYVDDIRITKGYGRYPVSCAVPTAAFFDVGPPALDNLYQNIALLLQGEGGNLSTVFTDTGGNPKTPTVTAGPVISTAQFKFGTSSMLFNGTGRLDYASNTDFGIGAGPWSLEGWIYQGAETVDRCLFDNRAGGTNGVGVYTSSATAGENGKLIVRNNFLAGGKIGGAGAALPTNQWVHIGVYWSGNTWQCHVNGTLSDSGNSANALPLTAAVTIGAEVGGTNGFNGYCDSLRVTKNVMRLSSLGATFTAPTAAYPDDGGDLLYSNVSLLLHGEGANLSTAALDSSLIPKGSTAVSGAKVSTARSRAGAASMLFNGTTDYFTFPNSADLVFGSGDFSVEAFVYFAGYPVLSGTGTQYKSTICGVDNATATNRAWNFGAAGTVSSITSLEFTGLLNDTTPTVVSGAFAFALNTWYFVSASRVGNQMYLHVDGQQVALAAYTVAMQASPSTLRVGGLAYDANNMQMLNGNIDELRITKGSGRYSATFAAPIGQLPENLGGIQPEHATALLTAPSMVASGYGGASLIRSLPSMVALGYGGGLGNPVMPAGKAEGHGPAYAALTGPSMYVTATGHDDVPNAGNVSMPMGVAIGYGAGTAQLLMPLFQLLASATTDTRGNAALSMPAGVAAGSASVTSQSAANLTLVGPYVTLGYGGASGGAAMGSASASGSGTVTSMGNAAIVMPLFQLIATGSVGVRASAALVMPMLRPGVSGNAALVMPGFMVVAVGSVHVTLTAASFEAWAVNLAHAQPPDKATDEVTHYLNFPFTQVVRFGSDYYGVGLDGLYKLGGDTDNAAAIGWTVRTHESDFDSANYKQVNSAYLGGRFGAQMTVTSHMGETAGGTIAHAYANPRTEPAQTVRQVFGKGDKARYFGLELADALGGELLLDTMDFEVNDLKRKI